MNDAIALTTRLLPHLADPVFVKGLRVAVHHLPDLFAVEQRGLLSLLTAADDLRKEIEQQVLDVAALPTNLGGLPAETPEPPSEALTRHGPVKAVKDVETTRQQASEKAKKELPAVSPPKPTAEHQGPEQRFDKQVLEVAQMDPPEGDPRPGWLKIQCQCQRHFLYSKSSFGRLPSLCIADLKDAKHRENRYEAVRLGLLRHGHPYPILS